MGYIGLEGRSPQSDESPRENLIINGFFDHWQRGDSQTVSGYGSADRWTTATLYTAGSSEKGYFTSDGTITGTYDSKGLPDNPKYFFRTSISSVTDPVNAWNLVMTRLPIAELTSGKEIYIKFWAKADAPKSIVMELGRQMFDSLGVVTIGRFWWFDIIDIGTEWKQYTTSFIIPEMVDATPLDGHSSVRLAFWLSGNTVSTEPKINLIAGQTGVFDIANVEMYVGSTYKPVRRKSYEEELSNCLRYYETGIEKYSLWAIMTSTQAAMNHLTFKVPKAKIPGMGYDTLGIGKSATGITFSNVTDLGCQVVIVGSGMIVDESGHISFNWQADAEI